MAPEGAVAVVGGNWQIFDKMVERSNATLYRKTQVTSIKADHSGDPESPHRRFVLSVKGSGTDADAAEKHPIEFDDVIIATPWQFSDMTASEGLIQQPIE